MIGEVVRKSIRSTLDLNSTIHQPDLISASRILLLRTENTFLLKFTWNIQDGTYYRPQAQDERYKRGLEGCPEFKYESVLKRTSSYIPPLITGAS